MEYMIGLALSLAGIGTATVIGLGRERAFYPTLLIIIASYYVLFAVMGASGHTVILESLVAGIFLLTAVIGFKTNLWFVVAALVGHGIVDFVHHLFIENPGVPYWWPGFCLAFDIIAGGFLAVLLMRHSHFSLHADGPNRLAVFAGSEDLVVLEAYDAEVSLAHLALRCRNYEVCFVHLERAHVLAQRMTGRHTYVHWLMLVAGLRRRDYREVVGQVPRMLSSLLFSRLWVPLGNTGRARLNALKTMPVPEDLRHLLDNARDVGGKR